MAIRAVTEAVRIVLVEKDAMGEMDWWVEERRRGWRRRGRHK